jgi:hypothetical protein
MSGLVRVIDGYAYVADDDGRCYDCYGISATGLTREGAVEAAKELLSLAAQLLTDDAVQFFEDMEAVSRLGMLRPQTLRITGMPHFAGPFQAQDFMITSEPKEPTE